MSEFKNIEIQWDVANEPKWIIESAESIVATKPEEKSLGLNLNVALIRRRISFEKLIDKFLAVLGLSMATTTEWQRIVVGVFLALIICPIHIKIFENNNTKKVFDLIENDLGDNYIDKSKLGDLNDNELTEIVKKMKREGMLEEEGERYYFKEIVLKNFNIG